METFLRDVRYAGRMLRRSRAFTAAAVLTLALGIGANTAIFSVVNAVLLRPLPYPDSDRLVIMWEKTPEMETSVSYPNFKDWAAEQQVFAQLGATRLQSFNLTGAGEPERLQGRMVTHGFFPALGVEMHRGRGFVAEEDRAGGSDVAVLSHGFWQRRFGGDESVLNRQITLNGRSYTV